MKRALQALILLSLLPLVLCIVSARGEDGADGSPRIPCPESCDNSRKNCELSCSQIVGGGVESGKRRDCFKACGDGEADCERDCGEEHDKCSNLCADPAPPPTFDPEVFENNPCAGACASKLGECEGTCSMFGGEGEEGGKRGECMRGCKEAEYNCVDACPR